LMNTKDI